MSEWDETCSQARSNKPAAPAPQAEGTHSKKCLDQLYSSLNARCICGLDGLKGGAAPAETARPHSDGIGGDCPGCEDCAGETAGEMTAEQFYNEGTFSITEYEDNGELHEGLYLFAEAFAKQRVEQAERERDTLKTAVNQELYDLRTKWNDAESKLREMLARKAGS